MSTATTTFHITPELIESVNLSPNFMDDGRPTWTIGGAEFRGDGTGPEKTVRVSEFPDGEFSTTRARRFALALLYAADAADGIIS